MESRRFLPSPVVDQCRLIASKSDKLVLTLATVHREHVDLTTARGPCLRGCLTPPIPSRGREPLCQRPATLTYEWLEGKGGCVHRAATQELPVTRAFTRAVALGHARYPDRVRREQRSDR